MNSEAQSSSAGAQPKSPVLLLLGCERSGTTFAQETLNRFYGVAEGNESQWVVPGWNRVRRDPPQTPRQQEQFIKSIFADWYFADKANYHQVYFDYHQFLQQDGFSFPRFVDQVFGHIAAVKNTRWALNKTCLFCEHMETVDQVFHQPRVVHLVRDGRDVALSLLEVKAWGPRTVYGAARWWARRVDGIQQYAAQHMEGRFLEIQYEELIEDPAAVYERITRFYGIHDPAKHAELARQVAAKKGNSGKWRSRMSPKQLELFERVAGETLQRNGYKLETDPARLKPLSPVQERIYLARDLVSSRIGCFPLGYRVLRLVNCPIGFFPVLQQRFFRSGLFTNHFNWNKNLRKIFKKHS
jgi:hypothetical protein